MEAAERTAWLEAPDPAAPQRICRETHYEPVLECGAMVRAGETVGLLHDFERLDLAPHAIAAGLDGIVVAQAWGAAVRQGQHILVVGRVAPFAT